ncbi:MAG: MerR family transcriptional regulator, partial [Solirubrobacterales bacterium]
MSHSNQSLNASQAAHRLGVSRKALRLYEDRGLVTPQRTAAGWRAYGPEELARAAEVVWLRALGLSLAEIARVMAGDATAMAPALAAHQAGLEAQRRQLDDTIDRVCDVRARLAAGERVTERALVGALGTAPPSLRIELPWPWGGELFQLEIRPLTYIVGPLGSGKTRLARQIAEVVPDAGFLAMERRTV